jgi:glyoxylase-like metal-dependent hydrolase (beta-lactamase superfamily II)
MEKISTGLSYIDLKFLGEPGVVASTVVHGASVALIDPGPASTLSTLEEGLASAGIPFDAVTDVLLTHIHLDHAGGTGTLVARNPGIRVHVHESGAPHLANPARLLASVTRLLGDDPVKVWGECLPVPAAALRPLMGHETIEAAGRRFEVAYTPGHASHHVSFLEPDARVAFVGDTAAMKMVPDGYVLPPTPPPDIDLPLWRASLDRIRRWGADTLFLTHFGPVRAPDVHLATVEANLGTMMGLAEASLDRSDSEAEQQAWFEAQLRRELRRTMTEVDVHAYEVAGRFDWSWRGLVRALRKQLS